MTNDEMIISYLESTLEAAYKNGTPIFATAWSTTVSHDDLNGIRTLDGMYASFLQRLLKKGYLDNTILFFMGDHGYRYGAFRETLIGYYEDKLPNMWITLPQRLKERFPHWQRSLELNTMYDILKNERSMNL
jgi:membrane-anchored protein YejM (alkaline phosphatase superfamily)